MSRKRFDDMNCSVARALDLVGDWWTLLIVREALVGTRRFGDFERRLGIAKNILSTRLERLIDGGILERVRPPSRRHLEYQLTAKGRDLWLVLTALRLWGDKWVYGEGREPLLARERDSGRVVANLLTADADGKLVDPRRTHLTPGPGATRETLERFEQRSDDETQQERFEEAP